MSASIDFLQGHTLTVYNSSWCPDCTRLESWMAARKVPHEQVLIDEQPSAAEKLEAETGKQGVPFILVDGKTWVRGYHTEERGRFSEAKLLDELRQATA
jgi:glutaredoxin